MNRGSTVRAFDSMQSNQHRHTQSLPAVSLDPEQVCSEMTCAICLNVPMHPVVTPCQHLFCRDCLAQTRGHGDTRCPTCRTGNAQSATALVAGSLVYRIWSAIDVKCGHSERGCPWRGSIADAAAHMDSCRADIKYLEERIESLERENKRLKSEMAASNTNTTIPTMDSVVGNAALEASDVAGPSIRAALSRSRDDQSILAEEGAAFRKSEQVTFRIQDHQVRTKSVYTSFFELDLCVTWLVCS